MAPRNIVSGANVRMQQAYTEPGLSPIGGLSRISQTASARGEYPCAARLPDWQGHDVHAARAVAGAHQLMPPRSWLWRGAPGPRAGTSPGPGPGAPGEP